MTNTTNIYIVPAVVIESGPRFINVAIGVCPRTDTIISIYIELGVIVITTNESNCIL